MADTNKNKTVEDQNRERDNAKLQHKYSKKQGPTDEDKGSLSSKTSNANDGGDQRSNIKTTGGVEQPSVGEIGTDRHQEKNETINKQVKDSENKNNRKEK